MTGAPFDVTLALRRDPYRFIPRTCAAMGTDAFATRLMLERTLCLTGPRAARFFYDADLFTREGAAPGFLTATLFGRGGVQGLDGAAHRRRKEMFLSLLGPGRTDGLAARTADGLTRRGATRRTITLQKAGEEVLTAAVCDWAGMPLAPGEVPARARMLSRLFRGAVPPGPRHLAARLARRRADAWARAHVEAVRARRMAPPEGSALAVIAGWTDADGTPLPVAVAAVELLNVLRPCVAISAYLTFAAHALAGRPELRAALAADPGGVPSLIREVRRTYPFFPLVAARARRAAEWRGHALPEGRLVVLDLYGTSRDPASWDTPEAFRPERFDGRDPGPFEMIPQGGGDHATGHRCAGEWATEAVMEAAMRTLLDIVDWEAVPPEDMSLDMRSLPALPGDGMRLRFRRA